MGIKALYWFDKTGKVWLFRDTDCVCGHKPELWAMETAYIPK